MYIDLSQGSPPSLNRPFVVALITEPPGALAIVSRSASLDGFPWNRVVRLTTPRRGKRFSANTEAGRLLRGLHEDGVLDQVFINLPRAYDHSIEPDVVREPDIIHLVRRLEGIGVPALLTSTPLWRPCFDQPQGAGTFASVVAAHLPAHLKGTAHEEEQCVDALLLAIFGSADAPDSNPLPFVPH